jgi:GAF domain-containing protein
VRGIPFRLYAKEFPSARWRTRGIFNEEIELTQTSVDQAVIAIENARLFEEVQARTRKLAKTVEDLEIARAQEPVRGQHEP